MKRSLLTILTVITWQLAMAQTNPIPNYDFENWTGTTLNNWYASSVAGCTKSTTAHSGSFALRMTPWNSSSYGANAYTPSSGQAFQLGGLYPTALTGWYMANFASGDQLQIDVSVYSGGGGTGTGVAFINTSASAYTQFTVSIYNSSAIADSAYIQFIEETSAHSTVGVNAGTYVILDDLNFIGTVGVQSFSANNLNVQVSPNPSGGLFSITTGKALEDNTEFKVMSVTGKEVFTVKAKDILTNSNYTLDLSNCAAGVYFAHIRSGDATEVKKLVVFQ